jgi:hypothetical protein
MTSDKNDASYMNRFEWLMKEVLSYRVSLNMP